MVSNKNFNELPNLNFGMQLKQLQCCIHPTIVSNILDHYMRRPQDEPNVVGTLLGSVDGQMVDLQTCFSVPADTLIEGKEQKLIVDKDYLEKMLKFHRRVNPKEDIIGFYMSGTEINSQVLAIFKMFQEIISKQKNNSLGGNPLLLLIDPTMQNNRLSIKVSLLVRNLTDVVDLEHCYRFDCACLC